MTVLRTYNHDDYATHESESSEARTGSLHTSRNGDLYDMTPPVYSELASEHETSVDAQATIEEKAREPIPSYAPLTTIASASDSREIVDNEEPEIQPTTPTTHLLLVTRCSILPNRPAAWILKRRDLALSPLAAAVLLKKGLITVKDLDLEGPLAPVETTLREPNDPVSGVVVGTFDAVGDLFKSLVTGPVEGGKYVAQKQSHSRSSSVRQDSAALIPEATNTRSTEPPQASHKPPHPDASLPPSDRPIILGAKDIAVGTGIGLGHIVGAGLKAPMTVTHGFTRGFHNLPKSYGGEVREYEVTDLKSGFQVSYKSFGHGIGDGLKDFFVQPVIGIRKEGSKGLIKGFSKGTGNLVCKTAAGTCGLLSYSLVGAYKQLQAAAPKSSEKGNEEVDALRTLGEMEYREAPEQTRNEVVRRWCQISGSRAYLGSS